MQVSIEILKYIVMIGLVNAALISQRIIERCLLHIYPHAISVPFGTPMCIIASRLPLVEGQKLLKKSIYVLLIGMLSGLRIQL